MSDWKKQALWTSVLLLAVTNLHAAPNPSACGDSFRTVDAELNKVYKQVMARFDGDTARVNSLKASQRAWLKFRDAEVESYTKSAEGGTVHGTCVCSALARLEVDRTAQLRKYLEGEEGDACRP